MVNHEYQDESPTSATGRQRTVIRGERTIGYSIVEAERQVDRSTAVVIFYPLSGCARAISNMKLDGYRCSVISVDRPLCGATSDFEVEQEEVASLVSGGCCHSRTNNGNGGSDSNMSMSQVPPNQQDRQFLQRINVHAQDVLEVLNAERVKSVYIVGVCIGHPYAVQVCRQLLISEEMSPSNTNTDSSGIQLCGLTLVAPFISTVCPCSWRVARLGAFVPSAVLYASTEAMLSLASFLVPRVVSGNTLKKLVSPEEAEYGGWMEEDYEDACQILLQCMEASQNARGVEARLGVSKIWQTHVCDKFAVESRCGLVLQEALKDENPKNVVSEPSIPIRIHASSQDKLASLSSIEWIAKRCYGNVSIQVEEEIHSHEVMTFFGGPPCNPVLLHKIVQKWGLGQ